VSTDTVVPLVLVVPVVPDISDRPTARPPDRATDRPGDRPTGRPTDRATDRPGDRPTGMVKRVPFTNLLQYYY
jgi:hypothetical protein